MVSNMQAVLPKSMPSISAYIPCYNNAETVCATIDAIRAQSVPVTELFVVDDGSRDNSMAIVLAAGVKVISMGSNQGRGSVRARAMAEAKGDLVLCCDATNALAPDFVAMALPWFDDPQLAAVFGRLGQPPARNAVERWRGRHLFKLDAPATVSRRTTLITFGTLVRRSAVLAVGNYDTRLGHTEDQELGERLLAAEFDVVYDPHLKLVSLALNDLWQVLERYRRWYAGKDERTSFAHYLRGIVYSIKGMAVEDFRAGDWQSIPISLLCPHYQFWRSLNTGRPG
jgi:glycosyltransferase involved in cell wall biosynthesis